MDIILYFFLPGSPEIQPTWIQPSVDQSGLDHAEIHLSQSLKAEVKGVHHYALHLLVFLK